VQGFFPPLSAGKLRTVTFPHFWGSRSELVLCFRCCFDNSETPLVPPALSSTHLSKVLFKFFNRLRSLSPFPLNPSPFPFLRGLSFVCSHLIVSVFFFPLLFPPAFFVFFPHPTRRRQPPLFWTCPGAATALLFCWECHIFFSLLEQPPPPHFPWIFPQKVSPLRDSPWQKQSRGPTTNFFFHFYILLVSFLSAKWRGSVFMRSGIQTAPSHLCCLQKSIMLNPTLLALLHILTFIPNLAIPFLQV